VNGNKELTEKLGRNDPCPAVPAIGFKHCCMLSGQFDGSDRDYFFQRLKELPDDRLQ